MIVIPKEIKQFFEIQINDFKAIEPKRVKKPNAYILHETLLQDKEVMRLLPLLSTMEKIELKDIEFFESDI